MFRSFRTTAFGTALEIVKRLLRFFPPCAEAVQCSSLARSPRFDNNFLPSFLESSLLISAFLKKYLVTCLGMIVLLDRISSNKFGRLFFFFFLKIFPSSHDELREFLVYNLVRIEVGAKVANSVVFH